MSSPSENIGLAIVVAAFVVDTAYLLANRYEARPLFKTAFVVLDKWSGEVGYCVPGNAVGFKSSKRPGPSLFRLDLPSRFNKTKIHLMESRKSNYSRRL